MEAQDIDTGVKKKAKQVRIMAAALIAIVAAFVFAFGDKIRENVAYFMSIVTTFLGVATLNDYALLVGIICTIITCAVNWWYKHADRQRR